MSSGSDWRDRRAILEEALEVPLPERARFLDRACGSDAELRRKVEDLIACDQEDDGFLDAPPVSSYEILEEIGRGGMGRVYRARDRVLGREIALKILPEEVAGDAERLSRFKSEAKLLASLNHPNIVQIYAVEEEKGVPFIAMELVHGKTLARSGAVGRKLSDFVDFAAALTDAIACAHDNGITHRDLKPANIMITDEGRLKVLDFGLAKVHRATSPLSDSQLETAPSPTIAGTIVGTLAYMSPEQAQGKSVDHRADIFSLGVIFYELLAGKLPFRGDSAAAILSSTLKDEPLPILELRPELPHELAKMVHRCLVKDPERRYQSVKDVRNELEASAAWDWTKPGSGPNETIGRGARSGFRRAAAVAVAAVVAALAGGTAGWLWRPRPAPPPVIRWTLSLPEGYRLASGNSRTPFDISPDGRYLAYIATDGEDHDPSRARVLVRGIDDFEAVPVAGSEGARVVFFSPDSRELAFHKLGGGLWRASVAGGAPVKIGDTVPLVSGTWGRESTIVFDALPIPPKLWRIPARGGDAQLLSSPEAHLGHRWPHFLPDGHRFLASAFNDEDWWIDTVTLDGDRHDELLRRGSGARAGYASSGHILIAEGGSLLAAPMDPERSEEVARPVKVLDDVHGPFRVSENGTLVYLPAVSRPIRMVQVDRNGETETTWVIERLSRNPIDVSPDGRRLAVSLSAAPGQKRGVAVYDLTLQISRQLPTTGPSRGPVWSPDGSTLAFQSIADGGDGLYVMPSDGSGDARAVYLRGPAESRVYPLAFTPDGEAILYREIVEGGGDFWMVPIAGGEPMPVETSLADEGSLSFSPDGQFVTFESNDSGRYEIYVKHFPGGRKWALSSHGGLSPVWAGNEIFYRNGDTIMVSTVELGSGPVRAGATTALFDHPDVAWYDVSPDGKHLFLLEAPGELFTELRVIQNWFSELERLVAR